MMKHFFHVVLALVLAGCATLSGGNEPQTKGTFSKVITGDLAFLSLTENRFAVYPGANGSYLSEGVDSERVLANTKASISQIMTDKGYVLVSMDEHPDFIIGFGLGLESKITDEEIFEKAGLVVGLSTEGINQKKFQKGTALVAIFTPGTKEPRWRALAQGLSDMKKAPEARKKAIHEVMTAMLSSVPSVASAPVQGAF